MCLFYLLLIVEEYRDAINGFNLDQFIRIDKIIGAPELVELAYNKYPHYLVGTWNLEPEPAVLKCTAFSPGIFRTSGIIAVVDRATSRKNKEISNLFEIHCMERDYSPVQRF